MEQPDEDKFSSGSEDELGADKTERKADEDPRSSASPDHQLTEEKTERKQDEDKRRASSEPQLSDDETHIDRRSFIPVSKRRSSSRIAADKIKKLKVIHKRKDGSTKGYGIWDELEEEMPTSSSSVSRKRQGRSRPENVEEHEPTERSVEITQVEAIEGKRIRKRTSRAIENEEAQKKCGTGGRCNCGSKCRCRMCTCGRGMKRRRTPKKDP